MSTGSDIDRQPHRRRDRICEDRIHSYATGTAFFVKARGTGIGQVENRQGGKRGGRTEKGDETRDRTTKRLHVYLLADRYISWCLLVLFSIYYLCFLMSPTVTCRLFASPFGCSCLRFLRLNPRFTYVSRSWGCPIRQRLFAFRRR